MQVGLTSVSGAERYQRRELLGEGGMGAVAERKLYLYAWQIRQLVPSALSGSSDVTSRSGS